ncbi:hypothetical protein ACVIN2_002446 [Bradyrhizobium sp. USDA 3650]
MIACPNWKDRAWSDTDSCCGRLDGSFGNRVRSRRRWKRRRRRRRRWWFSSQFRSLQRRSLERDRIDWSWHLSSTNAGPARPRPQAASISHLLATALLAQRQALLRQNSSAPGSFPNAQAKRNAGAGAAQNGLPIGSRAGGTSLPLCLFPEARIGCPTTRCHFVLTGDLHSVDESALHYEYVCKRVERREQVCRAMKA